MNNPREHSEKEVVLIVDDDDIFSARLARSFELLFYDVHVASSGEKAFQIVTEYSPDYAVIDLHMPEMHGLEVVRKLSVLDSTLRMVVLTGYGSIPTALDALRLGAIHYLQKPASVDELIRAFKHKGEVESYAPDEAAPSLARVEWEHIQRVLSDTDGNISETARRLGIHRRSLQRKLNKMPMLK